MNNWTLLLDKIQVYAQDNLPHDLLHGWTHIQRVLFYAEKVNAELKGNWDIIRAACMLHDIGYIESRELHHLTSCVMAESFLAAHGVGGDVVKHITECIETHSRQYARVRPCSPEARVLFDADGMDLFGAVGLMRAVLAAGTAARELPAVTAKIEWRLTQRENFYSNYAREYAKEHSSILESFLDHFKKQLSWVEEKK